VSNEPIASTDPSGLRGHPKEFSKGQFLAFLPTMKRMCNCTTCLPDATQIEHCQYEAELIIEALMNAWTLNFNASNDPGWGTTIGGHDCYDWVDRLKVPTTTNWSHEKDEFNMIVGGHSTVKIWLQQQQGCQFWADDGYDTGQMLHLTPPYPNGYTPTDAQNKAYPPGKK
jgi:hypothetical protein